MFHGSQPFLHHRKTFIIRAFLWALVTASCVLVVGSVVWAPILYRVYRDSRLGVHMKGGMDCKDMDHEKGSLDYCSL